MALANMISTDEDALICDLAEVYHIYDYESLPVKTVATFSLGLRAESRIKQKMSGSKVPLDTQLLALAVDSLNTLVWFRTEDGQKNRNRPKSVYRLLAEGDKEKATKGDAFESPEAFEKARRKILNELKGG